MKLGKLFAVISAVILITLLNTQQIQAFVWANDIVRAFDDESGEKQQQIEGHVITGASLFLQAQSQANLLLNEYELSGSQPFSCTVSLEYTEKTIALLENARDEYMKAKENGEAAGYNPGKTSLFKSFDYDAFIADNRLNKDIAKKVRDYLRTGNILGIYQQTIDDLSGMLDTLYRLRDNLRAGVKPDIKLFWTLMQQFSGASLFGNYSTLMGITILNSSAN
jgi:hypothetical protein